MRKNHTYMIFKVRFEGISRFLFPLLEGAVVHALVSSVKDGAQIQLNFIPAWHQCMVDGTTRAKSLIGFISRQKQRLKAITNAENPTEQNTDS